MVDRSRFHSTGRIGALAGAGMLLMALIGVLAIISTNTSFDR